MRGNVEIGFKMTDESCERTSREVTRRDADIGTLNTRRFCRGNVKGGVTCIDRIMDGNGKDGSGDMFDGVKGIWPRYDELTQTV